MLKDCQANGRFIGTVLVTEWRESPFRQKIGSFIVLTCQDASLSLSAKIWEVEPQHIEWLNTHAVFLVTASCSEYRGNLELSIESLQPLSPEEIQWEALLPSSPFTEEQLEERLLRLLGEIEDPELQELLGRVLSHPEWGKAYRLAPAAVKVHQAYLRGLWEHSLGVAELALTLTGNYPEADRELVLAGALLHDLGKIQEYAYDKGIQYTTDGRLLGHIIMGVEMLSREMAQISTFSSERRLKLLHILTSHHGRYEWQSPRRPKCIEAVIVHYADALEAELWQFKQAREHHPEEEWSPYVKSIERYLYLR